MKANILKHTGLTEKQFYAKYKTQKDFEDSKEGKAFMKAHGKELKKAQAGITYPSFQQSVSNTAPGMCPPNHQKNLLTGVCEPIFNYGTNGSPQVQSNLGAGFVRNPETNMYSKPQEYGAPQDQEKSGNSIASTIGKYNDSAGKLIEGIQQLKEQKKALKSAKQWDAVSDISLEASRTSPEEEQRRYVRPEDMVVNANQRFPSYGTGTNPLARNGSMIGGNPTEIQNMYSDEDTMYTDLGYEPLNDSSKVKQFKGGGGMMKMFENFGEGANPADFGNVGESLGSAAFKNNAGTKIGAGIGGGIGSIFGPAGKAIGQTLGSVVGGALDNTVKKTEAFQKSTMRNVNNMAMQQGVEGALSKYSAYVRNGGNVPIAENGYMSYNWNPQVIAKFGDMDVSEIQDYASDGLQSLRTGGHLRQNEQYAMGGQLKTHWGGDAETISYNPYLPGTGETIMFRGQSHDESDGQGNTGIGVQYGTNDGTNEANVEVERGEPMIELEQGGEIDPETGEVEKAGIVYGNLIAPGYGGKKFKNIVADLSKKEEKQNKIVEKSIDAINNMKVLTPMDITTLNSFNKMFEGANAKLKTIADEKKDLAGLQSAINDTAEEFGLDADALSKGNTKVDKKSDMYKAMFGKKVPKAQGGKNVIKKLHDVIGISPDTPGYGTDLGLKSAIAFNNWAKINSPKDYISPEKMKEMKLDPRDTFYGKGLSSRKSAERFTEMLANDTEESRRLTELLGINSSQPTIGDIKNGERKVDASGNTSVYDAETKNWIPDAEWMAKYKSSVTATPTTVAQQPTTLDPVMYAEVKKLYEEAKAAGKKSAKAKEFQQKFHEYFPEFAKEVILSSPTGVTGKGKKGKYKTLDDLKKAPIKDILDTNVDEYFGPRTKQYMATLEKANTTPVTTTPTPTATPAKTTTVTPEKKEILMIPAKQNKLAPLYNMVSPFLRRPLQEELDPNQPSGEMYALATNQEEPVQAQLYNPELDSPYSVSFQDRLNANQADFNALQRIVGYNPAALSALFAQKYAANDAVEAEEFRTNQALRAGVYDKNRDLINASKVQNLGILDQQYTRQAMAKSNTKAVTQLALNSISDKIAKNKLENRQLATYSNMFPQYGFDQSMRARNQGLTFFQNPTVGNTEPVYDKKGNIVGYGPDNTAVTTTTPETTTAIATTTPATTQKFGGITRKALRNGDILKSFKNL